MSNSVTPWGQVRKEQQHAQSFRRLERNVVETGTRLLWVGEWWDVEMNRRGDSNFSFFFLCFFFFFKKHRFQNKPLQLIWHCRCCLNMIILIKLCSCCDNDQPLEHNVCCLLWSSNAVPPRGRMRRKCRNRLSTRGGQWKSRNFLLQAEQRAWNGQLNTV